MSADKRSVHTDALVTLGTTPIPADSGKDAIHLAVLPVVAARDLMPGDRIGLVRGKATTTTSKTTGIVDPFIRSYVKEGDLFWMILDPRTITSLRHVWEHPDFPEEEKKTVEEPIIEEMDPVKKAAHDWIDNFAGDLGMSFDELMGAADLWVTTDNGKWGGEYTYDNSETYKDHWDKFGEFWEHYQTLTDKTPMSKDSFFTCSC